MTTTVRAALYLRVSTGRQADFVVPPGTYYVVARAGSVEARERLAVGPDVSQPERRQLTTSAISASPIDGRKNGTFIVCVATDFEVMSWLISSRDPSNVGS